MPRRGRCHIFHAVQVKAAGRDRERLARPSWEDVQVIRPGCDPESRSSSTTHDVLLSVSSPRRARPGRVPVPVPPSPEVAGGRT